MSKKLLIVNDIPGAGKVAGNINIPLFSAGRFETSILPTLILSKNTDYDRGEVIRYSMADSFQSMMDHWDQADIDFELYCTGFFNSADQISRFQTYFHKRLQAQPTSRLYIDPIMGDHGRLYPGFNSDIPKVIGELCRDAYLILPNVTEACLMTGYPYKEKMAEKDLIQLCQQLIGLGVEHVVLSGIEEEDRIGFFYYTDSGHYEKVLHTKYPYPFFGTGDMALSMLIICHEWGLNLKDSLKQTSQWIEQALEETIQLNRPYQQGVYFEPIIWDIAQFAKNQSKGEYQDD